MKKILGMTLALALMFSVTGCGKEEVKINDDTKTNQKSDKKTGNDWTDIDENNCMAIIKDKTGIDLSKMGAVTVTNAYGAVTKVADVTGNYKTGTEKVAMFENLIKELLRVSNNSIWSTDVNNETYKIEKVKEYKDYESFLEWKKNGNEELEDEISGSVYIENYSINYTFTNKQFNVHIANYVAK